MESVDEKFIEISAFNVAIDLYTQSLRAVQPSLHLIHLLGTILVITTEQSFVKGYEDVRKRLWRSASIMEMIHVDGSFPSSSLSLPLSIPFIAQLEHNDSSDLYPSAIMKVANEDNLLEGISTSVPAQVPSKHSDGEPTWGPLVVCDCMSRLDFARWLEVRNGNYGAGATNR